jgi:hypothetical protein
MSIGTFIGTRPARWRQPAGVVVLIGAAILVLGFLAVSPPPQHAALVQLVQLGRALVVLALVTAIALALPANALAAISMVVFATLQISRDHPLDLGPVSVYSTDVIVGLLVLRGLLPRVRRPALTQFAAPTKVAVGAWTAIMVVAATRGILDGAPPDTIVRLALPLFYWPLLYFGFARLFREDGFDVPRFVRAFVAVAVALVLYMAAMRAIHHPFETKDQSGHLGEVITASGTVFHRDYGFWSAYIVFPLLAIVGAAQLAYGRASPGRWALSATIGIVATFVTLIRGEMYGLVLGLLIVVATTERAASVARRAANRRVETLLVIAGFLAVFVFAVATVAPSFGSAILERSLPGLTHQAKAADETAQYRVQAFDAAKTVANKNPLGLGIVPDDVVSAKGVDPGYLVHSAPADLLVYTGWGGLVVSIFALLALCWESFKRPTAFPALHPAFIAILGMMAVYSLSAAGLFGQSHVIGFAVLAMAARFEFRGETPR